MATRKSGDGPRGTGGDDRPSGDVKFAGSRRKRKGRRGRASATSLVPPDVDGSVASPGEPRSSDDELPSEPPGAGVDDLRRTYPLGSIPAPPAAHDGEPDEARNEPSSWPPESSSPLAAAAAAAAVRLNVIEVHTPEHASDNTNDALSAASAEGPPLHAAQAASAASTGAHAHDPSEPRHEAGRTRSAAPSAMREADGGAIAAHEAPHGGRESLRATRLEAPDAAYAGAHAPRSVPPHEAHGRAATVPPPYAGPAVAHAAMPSHPPHEAAHASLPPHDAHAIPRSPLPPHDLPGGPRSPLPPHGMPGAPRASMPSSELEPHVPVSSVLGARFSMRPSPPPPPEKASLAWWIVVSLLSAIILAAGVVAVREAMSKQVPAVRSAPASSPLDTAASAREEAPSAARPLPKVSVQPAESTPSAAPTSDAPAPAGSPAPVVTPVPVVTPIEPGAAPERPVAPRTAPIAPPAVRPRRPPPRAGAAGAPKPAVPELPRNPYDNP